MKAQYQTFDDPEFPEPDPGYWWPDWYITWLCERKREREKGSGIRQMSMALGEEHSA